MQRKTGNVNRICSVFSKCGRSRVRRDGALAGKSPSLRLFGAGLSGRLFEASFLARQRERRRRREILRLMAQVIATGQSLAGFGKIGLAAAGPAEHQD